MVHLVLLYDYVKAKVYKFVNAYHFLKQNKQKVLGLTWIFPHLSLYYSNILVRKECHPSLKSR